MAKYRFEQIAINSTEKKKPVEEDRFTYLGLEHLDSGSLKVTRFGSEVAPIGEKLVMHKGDKLETNFREEYVRPADARPSSMFWR